MSRFFSDRKTLSVRLCAASILLYSGWLLLPSAQSLFGALGGAITVVVFGLGILLDWDEWRTHWKLLALQAGCALVLPVILFVFLRRGGDNFLAFYAQNLMLWYPLIFASYAVRKKDSRLWREITLLFAVVITITTITTLIWNIQSLFEKRIFETYSRMLGNGAIYPGNAKVLMLINIGSYDFIYALVLLTPVLYGSIHNFTGKKRVFGILLLVLIVASVTTSQYTYGIVYICVILMVEITASLVRRIFRVKTLYSFLIALVPLLIVFFYRIPLLSLLYDLTGKLGLRSLRNNILRLLQMFQGTDIVGGDRLGYYQIAWRGFLQSPVFGSALGGAKQLSQHSEVMDLLSGVGVIGTVIVTAMIWVLQCGLWRAVKKSAFLPHLILMGLALLALNCFGTSFYSRDVYLIYACVLLLAANHSAVIPSAVPGEDSTGTLPKEAEAQ